MAACLGIVPLCVTLFLQSAEPAAGGEPSMFRKSLIPAWFDGPDDHKQYDVDLIVQDMDLVDELDLEEWKDFIRQRHEEGKLFFAEMSPITHADKMLRYSMEQSGLQNAACLDLDLRPIPIGWMVGHTYQGRTPAFLCSNHPAFRAFLRQQVFMYIEAGADGIMVDDGGGSLFAYSRGGCFCEFCRKGFRQYLRAKYSTEQLRKGGIENIDSFDYRQFVLHHTRDRESYRKDRRKIPWTKDFQDFQRQSDVSVFASLQEMASKLKGAHVPFGWDNVDFGGNRAPYYPTWDVFYSEINYQNFGVKGRGPDEVFPPSIIMLSKLSDALGKWYTPTPAPRSWQAIRDRNLTALLQQWVAFTYANGGAMRYPRKGWIFSETDPWYYPPQEGFEPLYAFVRRHRDLFDDYQTVEQVGVLFTQSTSGGSSPYCTPLKRVCDALVNANVPFGFAVAGDELLSNRLHSDAAERFDVMLVPEPIRLIDGQAEIVRQWKRQNRAISVKEGDDLAKILADRLQPSVTLESDSSVWLFPRQKCGSQQGDSEKEDQTGTSLVCHLVNTRHGPHRGQTSPQRDVRIRLSNSLIGDRPVSKVTYDTIGKDTRELPFQAGEDGIQITVPEVEIWGILRIDGGA